jgi:DNA-binding MarR family transcriptional regulator
VQPVDESGDIAVQLHRLAVATAAVDSLIARRLGVSPTEYVALKHVMAASEPIGPVRLARLLGMTSGSATALVDRLEADGHVVRVKHEQDRRRVVLQASPATLRGVTRELAPLAAEVNELSSTFDHAERAAVQRFLALLATRYADHADTEEVGGQVRARDPR